LLGKSDFLRIFIKWHSPSTSSINWFQRVRAPRAGPWNLSQ
jgi:hypothetical protein